MAHTPIRNLLTAILAADAAGFSRLMATDERATLAALDAARAVFKSQIDANQGRVIDMAGDSVLAVFETATGAVDAALTIQQGLALLSAAVQGERMHFRIGVHLGDVIEKHDGTVYGDGVNVAARLQALAEPGGIVVSDAIRGVVSGRVNASFSDKGRQALKNIARPIHAYAIHFGDAAPAPVAADEAAAHDPHKAESAPAPPSPAEPAPRAAQQPEALFVGRKAELAQLSTALQAARKGFGRVVLLAGPGGMGKTSLAQQLALQAERDGTSVLWGRCLEEAGAPPYWPWRQLIRSHLRSGGQSDPAQLFGSGLQDIAGIVPEVAERFNVQADRATPGESTHSRFRLFDAVVGFWRRASRRAPLLLIFEDLHWADATSLRLFSFLANELDDSPVLVLSTYRDTELSRQHPLFETLADLARSSTCQRIELKGLSVNETEEFTAAASHGTASARLIDALYARTEGHPLFLEETLRYMIDARAPRAFDASGDDAQLLTRIPTGVREVIGKRLNRLSLPAVRYLSIAACIGRSFDLQLLTQLEADKSEDELLAALEEALAQHLIEPVPDSHDFRFGHALIRETLYDEMLGVRRARLHLRIGEMLEQRHGRDEAGVWSQLAYHFSEAGPGAAAGKALDYAKRAGGQAGRLLAFEESTRLYGVALQLLQRHFAGDLPQRVEVLLALGEAQMWHGAAEAASDWFRQAAEVARQCGLMAPFSRAAIGFSYSSTQASQSGEAAVAMLLEAIALHQGDDEVRVELIARLCVAYVYCDRAEEAIEAHRRAVALARDIGDMRSLYVALAAIATAIYWPEMLRDRLAAATEAWDIAEQLDLRERVSQLLAWYLCDLIHVGDVARLAQVREQGLQLAAQQRAPYWLSACRHFEVLVAINEGRFDDAERWATLAFREGRGVAEDKAIGAYGMQMFCLRREQGRLREALPMLQQFVQDTPKAQTWKPGLALLYAELDMREPCQAEYDGMPWQRISGVPSDAGHMTETILLGEVCIYLGDVDRAALFYDMLRSRSGMNLLGDSSGPCMGSADRLLGSLAMVMEQWDVAQRHFEAALAMDAATGWQTWLTHSRYRFAQMLQRRAKAGDLDKARALLADALVHSTALGLQALTPGSRR